MAKRPPPEVPPGYHGPVRSCAACRRRLRQLDLFRISFAPSQGILIGLPDQRTAGRGVYLCCDAACWERAQSKGLLSRALRAAVQPGDWERLRPALVAWATKRKAETPAPSTYLSQGVDPVCREEIV